MKNPLKKLISIMFFSFFNCLTSQYYVYPIGQIDNQDLLIMYQKSLDDLELWIWNRYDKIAVKELSSIFLPSAVQLLPSKTAYSFIDRGRIRVKQFNKRAPRVIDIYQPITAIVSMNWITDDQFYFVGKHEDRFSIFLCDITDRNITISCLHDLNDRFDYLYPCKIDQSLFCIARNQENHYMIIQLAFQAKPYQDELQQKMHWRRTFVENFKSWDPQSRPQNILFKSDQPLCFLSMESERSGFVLKLTNQDQASDVLSFVCCAIEQSGYGEWSMGLMFDFQLSKALLMGSAPQRLYESIYPFLPVYTKERIYFSAYNHQTGQTALRCYNRQTNNIEPIASTHKSSLSNVQHCFAPCIVDHNVYYGISCPSTLKSSSGVFVDELTGTLQCDLPEILLNYSK